MKSWVFKRRFVHSRMPRLLDNWVDRAMRIRRSAALVLGSIFVAASVRFASVASVRIASVASVRIASVRFGFV